MNILFAAICCGAISFTISFTGIFEKLRDFLEKKNKFLGELIHCPWCLNHYIVLVFLLTSDVEYINISKYVIYQFLFTWFVIVGISGILHYILLRAYQPVSQLMLHRKLLKLKNGKTREKTEEEVSEQNQWLGDSQGN